MSDIVTAPEKPGEATEQTAAPIDAPIPAAAPALAPPALLARTLAPEPAADQAPAADATPAAEPVQPTGGIGVLLVHPGTPDAATPAAVRRYLKEFLSDRRVIEKDTLFWKFLLNDLILPIRSRRKA